MTFSSKVGAERLRMELSSSYLPSMDKAVVPQNQGLIFRGQMSMRNSSQYIDDLMTISAACRCMITAWTCGAWAVC